MLKYYIYTKNTREDVMKKLLLILSFTLGLTTAATASEVSTFTGNWKLNPSYSECVKAIEKGVVITTNPKNGMHIFFYKDKIYTIGAEGTTLVCTIGENLK